MAPSIGGIGAPVVLGLVARCEMFVMTLPWLAALVKGAAVLL